LRDSSVLDCTVRDSIVPTTKCKTAGQATEGAVQWGAQVIPSFLDFYVGTKERAAWPYLAVILQWDNISAFIDNIVLPIVNA
jgi:hypothetical protein